MQMLRRITSGPTYLPFIDGLRFLAIMPVVLEHFSDFYQKKNGTFISESFYDNYFLKYFIGSSSNGVLLFFAISGFVLALPFAQACISNTERPDLKKYFLRRLTRLEPPYLIALTGIFLLNILVLHKESLSSGLPHYVASLIYSHNFIFHEYPTINFVLWSLEVEVQFYLLAPLLANIFKLKIGVRYFLFLVGILFFSILNHCYDFSYPTILKYLQYFIAGFWAADLYLNFGKISTKNLFYDVVGIGAIIIIWTGVISNGIFLPIIILLAIYCIQKSVFWEKILGLSMFTIVGGMCYSIYMLHYPAMAFLLNRFTFISERGMPAFLISLILVVIIILIVSALFFILIERPCMNKDWPKQLWSFITMKKTGK